MQDHFGDKNPGCPDYTPLSDFKYILANQHSKQFHLIDSPDLIYELSQYKFRQDKPTKFKDENPSSFNRKVYRHKSQQGSVQNDPFTPCPPFQIPSSNQLSQKFKPTASFLNQNTSQINSKAPCRKVGFKTKEKCYTSKEKPKQHQLEIDFKNFPQKQNLQTKILAVSRPSTSNLDVRNLSSNQSDPKSNWKKSFERKKYSDIKGKLQNLIQSVENCEKLNFSEVFEYQQAILKQYIQELAAEMKKECVQKGELIEMIWNTFFTLINKIMKLLIGKKNQSQKSQVQAEISLHEGYQEMHLYEANKIIELGKKYNESKNVIDRLIYELRFKRKQTKKLYKSLAICNQKLNQYKIQHIDLQNHHIDLLISARNMDKDEALGMMQRKLQVNKEKYVQLRVGMKKEKMKRQIEQELQAEAVDSEHEELFKKELFEKINAYKLKKKLSPAQEKQQNFYVEQFIEKYSNKFIPSEQVSDHFQITKTFKRQPKAQTGVNTENYSKHKTQLAFSMTQTTFSDKLEHCMINHHSTQTPSFQRLKKSSNVEVQADGDQMKIVLTKARMMAYKTLDQSFYFQLKRKQQKTLKRFSNRKSEISVTKDNDFSLIDQDEIDCIPIIVQKKVLSKKKLSQKRQKKLSLFNNTAPSYANLKSSNQNPSVKQQPKPNFQRKRASEMPTVFQMAPKQPQHKRYQKKVSMLSSQSFQNTSNRPSLCSSNFESLIENFYISEEKQKYIENYIMKKEQQFQIVQQNSIFNAFKDFVVLRKCKKPKLMHFLIEKGLRISEKNNQESSELFSEDCEFIDPKQTLTSAERLKENHKEFLNKKGKITYEQLNKAKQGGESEAEKQATKRPHFLQMVIEHTVNKSLLKKKVDSSNFQACKQKSQFTSITQKLDPFMLDVQCVMNQAFHNKKKTSSINLKAISKLLIMTYSRSIDKISRTNAILQNLIKPLFECFEVIYGAMKPNDIYRKMVGFISDIMSVKQSENFNEFIFFLGLDKSNINSAHLTTFDVCLYLKLLEKLNLGSKISSESQAVFTSKSRVMNELVQILQSQNISSEVIMKVQSKIKVLLQKLEDFVHEKTTSSDDEIKINLFKVSKMIVQQIIKIRVQSMRKLETYMTGSQKMIETNQNVYRSKNDLINVSKIKDIVECCRISTTKKLYFSKCIEELMLKGQGQLKTNIIKRSELGVLLIRIGLVNFEQLEDRIRYFDQREKISTDEQTTDIKQKQNELNYSQFGRNLQKLVSIEVETSNILENMLGDLMLAYQVGLVKNLENKKDKPKSI